MKTTDGLSDRADKLQHDLATETAGSESALNDLLCCPHCGSDEGINTTYWEQRICLFGWDGAMVESDIPTGGFGYPTGAT